MVLMMGLVLDVAVIMIPVQTAERKFCIDFVFGFDAVSIVTGCGDQIVDLRLGDFAIVVDNLKILGLGVPARNFYARMIECRFNTVLAHDAVSRNFDIGFGGFPLRVNPC